MAIPMIEAMRQRILTTAKAAIASIEKYQEEGSAESLQNMNETNSDLDLMMESLKPEEIIELLRKN